MLMLYIDLNIIILIMLDPEIETASICHSLFSYSQPPYQTVLGYWILAALWYCCLYVKWDYLKTKTFPEVIFFLAFDFRPS